MSSRHMIEAGAPPPAWWDEARAALVECDPVLAGAIAAAGGAVLRPRRDAFHSLARSIVGQQISVSAAEAVWQRLVAHCGADAAIAPDAAIVPDAAIAPDAVAGRSVEELRGCGLSRPKARYLVSLAEHFASGAIDPRELRRLDDEAAIAKLREVKGIGRWTAEMFLIFHLLRPDVLPVADIGVQRAVGNLYAGGERPDADDIRAVAEPWRPWRSVAVWYLWRSLDAVPVAY